MTYKELAQFIKQERKKQKLTQQQLADKAEVSRRTILYIEGEKETNWRTLEKIVKALGYIIEVRILKTK